MLSIIAWLYVFGIVFHSVAKDRLYEGHRVPAIKYSTFAKVDALLSVLLFFSGVAYAVTINEKLSAVSGYIENTINGSKKRNSETVISGRKSKRNIPIAIRM